MKSAGSVVWSCIAPDFPGNLSMRSGCSMELLLLQQTFAAYKVLHLQGFPRRCKTYHFPTKRAKPEADEPRRRLKATSFRCLTTLREACTARLKHSIPRVTSLATAPHRSPARLLLLRNANPS